MIVRRVGGVRAGGWERFGRLAGLVVIALCGTGSPAVAQTFEFGGGFSRLEPPGPLLGEGVCTGGNAWTGEGVVALRLTSITAFEATGGYNWSTTDMCGDGPPDIPPTGDFSYTYRETSGGYPFWNTDFRFVVESPEPHQSAWLRAFGGYGRMWSKDIGYWLAGGGLALAGRLQPILEAEWNWFSVPFDEFTANYTDGTLVSTDTVSGSTSHTTFRIRAGLRWRLR